MYFSFIPTIIAGQFLSYFQAIQLDKRAMYFTNIINYLDSDVKLMGSIRELGKAIKAGYFNQGYSVIELQELHHRLERYLKSNKNEIDLKAVKDSLVTLGLLSRRTIDTIKHQAKTITVGAVRETSAESEHFGAAIIEQKTKGSKPLNLYCLETICDDIFIITDK
jgi:hypothetical protein